LTFHTTNRQIIISGCQVIAHLCHNNYSPASRNATANRRQQRARSTAADGSLQHDDSQAVSETAEIFDQNNLFWSPVWYLLHCNLVLIRDQNNLFWSMAAKRLRPLSRKGEPGASKSCFSQPLAPILQTRKKGAENLVIRQVRRIFAVESCSDSCHTYAFHSGLTGFDGEMKWYVSTRSVGGLLLNLSLQAINWQQQVCSRCLVEAQ